MTNISQEVLAFKIATMAVGSTLNVGNQYSLKLDDVGKAEYGITYSIFFWRDGKCILRTPILLEPPKRQRV